MTTTLAAWRTRYESSGGLVDISRRCHSKPNRITPAIQASICEMRRQHRRWGARRTELGDSAPSRATVHRALARNGLINPQEQQHKRTYKRWEREAPMHLWQLDLVGGIFLVGGRECKILTGIDDHFPIHRRRRSARQTSRCSRLRSVRRRDADGAFPSKSSPTTANSSPANSPARCPSRCSSNAPAASTVSARA
ncbi:helix-turn-helix domain-containing protein [Rhodococcus sp. 15-725-2-2b]|uniref:helix-turn-helix domain-containing protein n=1 Tax=Rhodococcus sp. 15-725-2-2b TaxID=2023139 RepID=UPI003F913B06